MIVLQNTLMNTQHVLTLCYVSKVNIIEVINILSVLEVLSIVLEMGKEIFLLVILYCMPSPFDFCHGWLYFTD